VGRLRHVWAGFSVAGEVLRQVNGFVVGKVLPCGLREFHLLATRWRRDSLEKGDVTGELSPAEMNHSAKSA
jgi:hypothetical protein